MAKRKIIRKSNRPLTINSPKYYNWGGDFKAAFNMKDTFSGGNVANMLVGGLGSAVGKIGGNLIGGDLESGAGSTIGDIGSTIGGAVSAVNPLLGGLISAGSGIISGLTNRMFGSKMNKENIAGIEGSNKATNTLMVDNSSANAIERQWATQDFGSDFSQSDVGKDGWFSNKAKNKYNELKTQQDIARNRALNAFENAANAADTNTDLNAMASFAAYGGPLNMWGYGGGVIDYEPTKAVLANGGKIHIKPENKGKFTKYCGGKVTSECIAKGKKSSDPAVRKRATFSANARKWHHALGGYLYDEGGNLYTSVPNIGQHGGDFSNGVTIIGNGGTHEENPMEGVPMGIAPDGAPNLVEQGEVKFNNYIFSNRLFATSGLLAAHNLPATYADHTFADIAERLNRESSERPNDPISKRGLMSTMTRLQQAQEQLKEEKQSKKYAKGGHLFVWGGPDGMYPYDEEDDVFIVPTGSKIAENPFADDNDDSNYQAPVVDPNDGKSLNNYDPQKQGSGLALLRYAPVVGAGLGVLADTLGRTNNPDYSNANLVGSAVDNLTNVGFTPIGNYLTYKPLDRNYYINRLNAQAGATRRAIVNQSGGNRATALAGLLAADYNTQSALGNLARQAEEYNLNQRKEVEAFNRGTNQFNSEMGLRAAIANKENDKLRLQARIQQAQLRDQADARASAGRAANLTNLFDSLGEIGREEFSRNMIQTNPASYYSIDRNGNITYKNGYDDLSEAEKKSVREAANKDKKKKKAKGGYLTIRGGK